jgi:hypothetical protein
MKLFDLDKLIPQLVPVDDITSADFQPESRTTRPALKELERDILETGLVYPLVIDANGGLIDGHRRFSVLVHNGCTEIPCLILDEDQAERFAAVNGTVRTMRGKDAQEIYAKDPAALMPRQRNNIRRASEYMGSDLFSEIVSKGDATAVSVYNIAQQASHFVSENFPAYHKKHTDEEWARAVYESGQRKVRDVISSVRLSPLGKAEELLTLLFGEVFP